MRFKRLDLNLLVALDMLLAEQSVSAAAQRMCLSQPAMSGALNRLREYFNDDLLVLSGRRMVLTARATELIGPVRAALVQIETTIAAPPVFDPLMCDRRFVIEASDYMSEVLIAPVSRQLAELAPQVSLDLRAHGDSPDSALESGEIDLIVTPDLYASPEHPSELLFEEDHVVVGWRENRKLHSGITLDDFYAMGHVSVHFRKGREAAFAESHLGKNLRLRRIEVSVPAFCEVPRYLIGTQRIALMHRRLANAFLAHYPLAVAPAPLPVPSLREVMQHHRIRSGDRALAWLRRLILDTVPSNDTAVSLGSFQPIDELPVD